MHICIYIHIYIYKYEYVYICTYIYTYFLARALHLCAAAERRNWQRMRSAEDQNSSAQVAEAHQSLYPCSPPPSPPPPPSSPPTMQLAIVGNTKWCCGSNTGNVRTIRGYNSGLTSFLCALTCKLVRLPLRSNMCFKFANKYAALRNLLPWCPLPLSPPTPPPTFRVAGGTSPCNTAASVLQRVAVLCSVVRHLDSPFSSSVCSSASSFLFSSTSTTSCCCLWHTWRCPSTVACLCCVCSFCACCCPSCCDGDSS